VEFRGIADVERADVRYADGWVVGLVVATSGKSGSNEVANALNSARLVLAVIYFVPKRPEEWTMEVGVKTRPGITESDSVDAPTIVGRQCETKLF
jgi:hypothetical protein